MNDTRKAIIELIEPYMENDLVEGCLLRCGEYITICSDSGMFPSTKQVNPDILGKEWEIIGHYDISAVLKYITNKGYVFEEGGSPQMIIITTGCGGIIGKIPLKPLHLFDKKQEQELLYLLLKLKNG